MQRVSHSSVLRPLVCFVPDPGAHCREPAQRDVLLCKPKVASIILSSRPGVLSPLGRVGQLSSVLCRALVPESNVITLSLENS